MKKFLIYDSSGDILRWGLSSNATFKSKADVGQGEKMMESDLIKTNVEKKYKVVEEMGKPKLKLR